MTTPFLPDMLRFGSEDDPLRIEFDRRTGYYAMENNHYHIEHELYYLFQGERNYFIKDSAYRVQAGDMVLVDSNALHKTSDLREPNHERIVLYYSPSFFAGYQSAEKELLLAPFALGNPLIRLNLQEKMHVEALLASLLNELNEQPPGYQLHIRNVAVELLLFTSRYMLKRQSERDDELSPVRHKVTDIIRHINLHFGDSLQLHLIAKQFFISKSHLSRVFKQMTGFGFTEYVNITRVREAERLLRETDWSILHVSEHCGFESFSHFGKVFKKLSGVSPRSYRKFERP
ncbi:AraC family transcriptional regulator [Paenibacillus sp. GCM10023248]|uniref:helix-turn-helix transcriptional regulator n=1 Tax=Bacillales TaxID=1385 RepID=UPI002378B967|nr:MULTISPECIES: AraC family transcriptional regulator [Bacillales]MDD9269247.1 AraC family transcriptional regulator [Paenibacillus sp. MAHUQ-63]MDR6880531.1 AraC-like DNA-binding protein [Bacillus sp. 3255]